MLAIGMWVYVMLCFAPFYSTKTVIGDGTINKSSRAGSISSKCIKNFYSHIFFKLENCYLLFESYLTYFLVTFESTCDENTFMLKTLQAF